MKEVTLYGGTIDSCLKDLREMAAADESGEVLKAVFNDKYLLSTDTYDDAYLRITGKTKAEHDEYVRKWQEDYEAKRKAHSDSIDTAKVAMRLAMAERVKTITQTAMREKISPIVSQMTALIAEAFQVGFDAGLGCGRYTDYSTKED